MMRALIVGFLILFGLAAAPMGAVQAQENASMTWKLRSFDKHPVELKFYSRSRKVEWPAPGQVWVLRDFQVKNFNLRCVPGEKICYGAWQRGNTNKYWGIGRNGKDGCKDCCYTCKDGLVTTTFDLNE